MKRLISLIMALVLLCSAVPALAGDDPTYYAVVHNPDPADRLNLRMHPFREALSLGKYFNGVIVRVLQADDDGWAQVRIGDCVGYMMLKYLSDPTEVAVASAMPSSTVSSAYADAAWLLDDASSQANRLMQLCNGTPVVVLGIAGDYAHVQISGITGFVPLADIGIQQAGEYQDESDMPVPESLEGRLIHATLVTGDHTFELSDVQQLQTLSGLLTSTAYWGFKMAGCPMNATLTLDYADSAIRVIELATDSCCVYRCDGHDFMYARSLVNSEGSPDSTALFSLFGAQILP